MWRAVDREGEVLEILVEPPTRQGRGVAALRKLLDVRASFRR
jgi:hypothetical protein